MAVYLDYVNISFPQGRGPNGTEAYNNHIAIEVDIVSTDSCYMKFLNKNYRFKHKHL